MTEETPKKESKIESNIYRGFFVLIIGYFIYSFFFAPEMGEYKDYGNPKIAPANLDTSNLGVKKDEEKQVALATNPYPPYYAVDFPVMEIGKGKSSLLANTGKVQIVTFWAPWCSACVRELPWLETLQKKVADKADVVLVATQYGSMREVSNTLSDAGVKNSRLYLDNLEQGFAKYQIKVFPTTVIIDRFGVIRYRKNGVRSWHSADAINDVLDIAALPEGGVKKAN